ncbi:MAG: hypothetical protein KatS3mg077_0127 [Candidatus Binatia bacterium]|nr:MAG: hypothetical protein KatS3mg077_0127 [Candidatus Binatia bacterium]
MLGKTITKSLISEFLVALLAIQFGVAALYILVDFFERLDVVLTNDIPTSVVARYFAYKLPLVVYQTLPAAVTIALLSVLVQRHRHREIIALNALGIGPRQIAAPMIAAAMVVSVIAFLWGEIVVPPSLRSAQEINLREIKKRDRRNILAEREIWFRGPMGIYHVAYVDRAAKSLLGVTTYELGSDFTLSRVTYFPELRWTPSGWISPGGSREVFPALRNGDEDSGQQAAQPTLQGDFEEFAEVQREPEELSLHDMWRQRALLKSLGLPTTRLSVELYLKTALPFAPLALALALLPLNLRLQQPYQISHTLVASAFLGFAYWLLLGLASSLGQAGTLSPLFAAWVTNAIYAAVGCAFLFFKTAVLPDPP